MRARRLASLAVLSLTFAQGPLLADGVPGGMKFGDVREIAPGVFFRYSAISPTDMSVFGGCNNIWIIFEDYVAVIDANFPKEAGDVIEAIRKTTDKPVRYVLDTHHHGDHAYGNLVFGKAGAQIVAQSNCARLLHVDGPKQFAEAGHGPGGRKDIAASALKTPNIVFDEKLVLEDGKQRVEFLFMGHAHTAGDAVAYLPKYKILCTGDACVNGAFNFMGHSDSASWIRALERMQQLDVKVVCPGHGPMAPKDLLEKQKRFFVELRRQVKKGIDAGLTAAEVAERIDLPWYKEWTSVKPSGDAVKHVYAELTGTVAPWDFAEDFGVLEGPSPGKDLAGWKAPGRIVVPSGLMPARLDELKRVAPEVEFLPAKNTEAAARLAEGADAVIGFWSPEIAKAGKALRWVHTDDEVVTGAQGNLVVTNSRGVYGPPLADHAFELLLPLLRKGENGAELHGKTIVVVGRAGSANPVARRANAFGMRVRLVDDKLAAKPDFAFSLEHTSQLASALPTADVVVVCCPLTDSTRGLLGSRELALLKPSAFVIDVGRSGVLDLSALADAVRGNKLAGAGLDLTEPLPRSHGLNGLDKVTVAAQAATSPEARERRWRLLRENVRRFTAGEPLLCVIER
jgi:phosphoglycerate dehydrogenase-like enzyme/glyoxylase-like metal-dependent hydrolase (beta-lactamase superfamily II)